MQPLATNVAQASTQEAQEQVNESEQPTPQEQEAFDRVELAANQIANKEQEALVQTLSDGAEMPAKTMAQLAMTIFSQIDESSGGKIPEEVILRGAEVVLDVVIEVAEGSGAFQVDENMAAQSLQEMVVIAGEMYDVAPEELQAELDSMDQAQLQGMVSEQEQIAGGQNVTS